MLFCVRPGRPRPRARSVRAARLPQFRRILATILVSCILYTSIRCGAGGMLRRSGNRLASSSGWLAVRRTENKPSAEQTQLPWSVRIPRHSS
jgi:hypothetical protein